jgi:DNA polymerase
MNNICHLMRNCQKCDLCKNQQPLIQTFSNNADIFWVGLSAVKTTNRSDTPLSQNTNSGKLIHSIEFVLPNVSFYKTNIVKCLPLKNDKIRYPSISEMKNCYFHFETEIKKFNPKIIFLLGKQVKDFVLNNHKIKASLDNNFNYSSHFFEGNMYIPIHHPSFILVYKRKKLSDYMQSIENIITSNIKY